MLRRVSWNVIWNTGGTLTGLLAGFVVAPFLVAHLGKTGYGLWLLIASLTGYFSVLDLGISGSVGRNLAFCRAKDDIEGVNSIFSTASVLLLAVAGLAVALTVALVFVFPIVVPDIAADELPSVQLAVVLVGLSLALSFPLGVFGGVLWAAERFDWQNWIDIPTYLLRMGLTIGLVGMGHGLVALGWITLLVSLLQGVAKAIVCFRLERRLRFRWSLVTLGRARELYDYGIWYFLLSLSRTITPQLSPLVVGNRLGPGLVPAFRAAAGQLVAYANTFMITGTQVLTPVATALHAQQDREQQRRLFLEGGKTCLVLALAIFFGFFFLGQAFITCWLGKDFAGSWLYLVILAGGEVVPMSQWISYSLILGMARHRPLALYGIAEMLLVLALAVVLTASHGLAGTAVAVAVPATLCRGLGPTFYACRLVEVRPWTYAWKALVPAVGLIAPFAVFLLALTSWHTPTTWPALLLETAAGGVVFLATAGLGLLGRQRLRRLVPGSKQPAAGTNATTSDGEVGHAVVSGSRC